MPTKTLLIDNLGKVFYFPLAISHHLELGQVLKRDLPWRQDFLNIFGQCHPLPRLQCWMADPTVRYRYSGIDMGPTFWTDEVRVIKDQVETLTGFAFNSVLCNLYRNGLDSNGWHADDEKGVVDTIASVSFGATRDFQMRLKKGEEKNILHTIRLEPGSLLLMTGGIQKNWKHCLPKRKKIDEWRINLTFRMTMSG